MIVLGVPGKPVAPGTSVAVAFVTYCLLPTAVIALVSGVYPLF